MSFQPWAFIIGAPPFAGIAYLGWKLKREMASKRYPFHDPVLRPPGEGCRVKIDDLMEKAVMKMFLFVTPIFIALSAYYANAGVITCWVILAASIGFTIWMTTRLADTAIALGNYRLGFDGERLVGQELNQGLSYGWRVFHDVPFDDFNVDHVVVAPSGVYAVETKARRKRRGSNSHRLKYDGERLVFPEWEDDRGLEQARRNAKTLSVWLSSAIGKKVWVEPILTLPGWLIDRNRKGLVHVLNPKEINRFVQDWTTASRLDPEQIQQIAHQLEQKCVMR